MTILEWVIFFLGFPALLLGADFLVKGSSAIAAKFGVPSVVIGLTIVAFGTSAPELLISVQSAIEGQVSMAVGNVVGSNIANILLILGAAPLFKTFITKNTVKRVDIILFSVSTLIITIALMLPFYGKVAAIISLIFFVYVIYNSWMDVKKDTSQETEETETSPNSQPLYLLIIYVIVGIIGLAKGADWLVDGGQKVALLLHISPAVVGLIFFAVGTSLPELATSIYAARKNEFGLALGNVVGSNIFNAMLVLPVAALFKNIPADRFVQIRDLPILFIASAILVYVTYKGLRITKLGGLLLLTLYGFWVVLIALTAHSSLS
ncbi:MAG: calcium/sodium antiporter [Alphaproteobacteria bacterium]